MFCAGEQVVRDPEQHQCPYCKIVFYKEKKLKTHITKFHETPEMVAEDKCNIMLLNSITYKFF